MSTESAVHAAEDRLIDLASGLMAGSERDRMLSHLRVCAGCEEGFREICGDAEALRARRPHGPHAASGTAHAAIGIPVTASPMTRRRLRWSALAAAAVVAVATLAILRLPRLSPSRAIAGATYWYPVQGNAVALRSGARGAAPAPFVEAAQAYRRRDTATVVRLLEGRVIPPAQEPMKIILASALCHQERYDEALRVLDALHIDTLPSPAKDRARWLRYLALRELGRGEEARRTAEQLASTSGEFASLAQRELAAPGRAPF